MRQIFLAAILISSFQLVISQKLQVEIQNIRSPEGQIILSYYTNHDDWLDEDFTDNEYRYPKKGIVDGKLTIELDNLAPGIYGIAFSDDENGDGKMNYNFMGVPREGFGFSRNHKVRWRKPRWEESNFKLEKDTTIIISVQYKL